MPAWSRTSTRNVSAMFPKSQTAMRRTPRRGAGRRRGAHRNSCVSSRILTPLSTDGMPVVPVGGLAVAVLPFAESHPGFALEEFPQGIRVPEAAEVGYRLDLPTRFRKDLLCAFKLDAMYLLQDRMSCGLTESDVGKPPGVGEALCTPRCV